MKKILEVIEILRKDNKNKLWDKSLKDYTENDWKVIDALDKGEALILNTDIKKGGCKSKRVIRLSDNKVYSNGKEYYLDNGISKAIFYNLITGRKTDMICDFKYI